MQKQVKLKLNDNQLKASIKKKREQGIRKLQIVKWVWDNCDRGLKDSKQFVDDN